MQPTSNILIVDDEAYIRRLLTRWLTLAGYACEEAPDASFAQVRLAQGGIQLVISDILMPGMNGLELLEAITGRYPDVAVVLATAVDDRATAIRALHAGAFGYLIKPFDENEVIICVANALERKRLQQRDRQYSSQLELEVHQRTVEIRARESEVAMRLIWASEYRDDETGAHIQRLSEYAVQLARACDWSVEEIELLRLAAPMHDIGKIGVPDAVLRKPGSLTVDEFKLIKQHTLIGAQILSGSEIPLLRIARDIALCHHERWDGGGYPKALEGEAIPRAARLVAILDVYDALIHDRVYRPAMPRDEALAILKAGAGRHFDPDLLARFFDILPALDKLDAVEVPIGIG